MTATRPPRTYAMQIPLAAYKLGRAILCYSCTKKARDEGKRPERLSEAKLRVYFEGLGAVHCSNCQGPAPMTIRAANGLDLLINDRFSAVRWVEEGMYVIAPVVFRGKPTGLRCTVTVAAGHHARVVCERHNFAHWFHINDLREEVLPTP